MKSYKRTLGYFATKSHDFITQMTSEYLTSLAKGKLDIHVHEMTIFPESNDVSISMLVVKKSNRAEMGVRFSCTSRVGTITLTRYPQNSRGIMRDPENDMELLDTIPLADKDKIKATLNRYLSY